MKRSGKITLYHFCAAKDVKSIRENGLTLGMTPILTGQKLELVRGTQWLTKERDPGKQSWHTYNLVSYSRTAYRLTIDVPGSHRKKLIPAREFIERFPLENAGLVRDWPGSDMWYVFTGEIPPGWIVGCKRMEKELSE